MTQTESGDRARDGRGSGGRASAASEDPPEGVRGTQSPAGPAEGRQDELGGAGERSVPRTPRSRSSVLVRRLIAGFVIAPPFVLGAYAGGGWVLLGVTIPTFLALREFYALSRRPGRRVMEPLGFLLAFGILLANGGRELLLGDAATNGLARSAALSGIPGGGFIGALLTPDRFAYFARFSVAAAVIVPLIALLFERGDTRGRLTGWALTLAGTLYVAWLISHFQTMRLLGGDTHAGRGWIFYTFAATWTFDTGAYLVGTRFGKTPFMSHISPKKTWEGTVGGFVFCLIATLIATVSLPAGTPILVDPFGWSPLPIALWQAPLLALGMSAAAAFGDLAESMIKREAGAKDAGELIPGHGGMLDRIDSLLFTVVLAYYYAVWFGGLG